MGDQRYTESGIPVQVTYGPADLAGFDPEAALGEPGRDPFTRGIYPTMYRGRAWTMRQYAGFGSAAETNARFRYLLDHGQTGLSVAFDLPTQMGYDSDHPMAAGEVGKVGVAIDSLADMRRLFEGIPLDQVSTSMTINAPAAVLLLLYQLVGEEQGVDPAALTGTVQNDVLKEYIARGTYIYPPAPSLRIATDLFAYCAEHLPRFNTISISGYHMAEAGATAVQEIAFTLSNAIAYVQAAVDAGLAVDAFAPRLAFFFVARTTLFEEAAKFRAARRIWADTMAEPVRGHRASLADAALPHPDGRGPARPPSSRSTTSSGWPCRAWRRCSAAPSRCTPTPTTRPWPCPARPRPASPCGPSRSWPTRPGSPTRSTRWPGRTSWSA